MFTKKNKNSKMKTIPKKKFNIDRNQLFAYLLAFLIIFWTVASVFGFIAYGKTTKRTSKSGTISASAQTVGDISRSGYLEIELPYLQGLQVFDGYTTHIYSAPSLLIYNDSLKLRGVEDTPIESSSVLLERAFISYDRWDGILRTDVEVEGARILNNGPYTHYYSNLYDIDGIFLDYTFEHRAEEWALCANIVLRVDYNGVMHDYSFTLCFGYWALNPDLTTARYTLSEFGATYDLTTTKTFENELGYGIPTADFLAYYRLAGSNNPDASITYEIAYNNGYQQGNQVGVQEAINNAYDSGVRQGEVDGYNDGFAEGKALGYEEGLNSANTYTFSNLLTAVFDVPATAFSSLLDIDILGVNMLSFFSALFTAGLIICVIRLIL